MRLVPVVLAAALLLPVALASHPVNHDPLGFEDPDGPLLSETCRQVLFEGAPPFPEVPLGPACQAGGFLAEAATDGYVLQIQRLGPGTFELRVRHGLDLGQGPLPLGTNQERLLDASRACATAAACSNQGIWVHATVGDDRNPLTGHYYPQVITAAPDGLNWTIAVDTSGAPVEQVVVVVVAQLASGEWLRGFYHPAKVTLALDLLDVVPYPTLV